MKDGRFTIIPSGVEFPVEVFYYTDPSFRNVQKQFQYVWPLCSRLARRNRQSKL